MTKNVGNRDRLLRFLPALLLFSCSVAAPLPSELRLLAFALPAVYLLFTALSGWCLGYAVMGRTTCQIPKRGSS